MLVDHNYQIEQGEIQQRSNNTTYTVLTTNRDKVIERILLPTNVESFLYFIAGTYRRSSSFTLAPEIRLFRRILECRSTAMGCAVIPPPPELELEAPEVSLSGVVQLFAPTFHSRSFFIARFASRCWFLTSFWSRNWTINQPRHKVHRVLQLSVPFQCLRMSRYRPGFDRVPTRCSLVFVDLPNRMPRSHDEPSLPSWTPDSFASSASAKLSERLWTWTLSSLQTVFCHLIARQICF